MIPSRKSKSVGLFSGGLDSILAAKLVTEQGAEAVALHFKLPFLSPARPSNEERLRTLAELAGASFISVEVGPDYMDVVRNPRYDYSRNLAPCVDCILYMLEKARELAREIKADFVFTGEVVGQRAHCQNKRSLKLVEKAARMEGRLLRPLSAKLLDPTIPEMTNLIRRERLLDIKGRGRRRQIRLAHEFGIIDYSPPTGGCLLTDSNFAAKARDLTEHDQLNPDNVARLHVGRHFRLESGAKVIVGRNERENNRLEKMVRDGDVVCQPVDVMGPLVVLSAEKPTKGDIETAARICARYADGKGAKPIKVRCGDKELKAKAVAEESLEVWRIRSPEPEPEAEAEQAGEQADE